MTLQSNLSAALARVAAEFKSVRNALGTVEYLDPATAQASLTYALPSSPGDKHRIEIHFGGTISYGETVASSFNFTGGTVHGGFPREVFSGDVVELRFRSATSTWYATHAPANTPRPFTLKVKTDNTGTSNDDQFTFPATAGSYSIDWGDGSVDTEVTGPQTHTYSSAGEYVVKVIGGLTSLAFNNGGDKEKVLELQSWGDIAWSTFNNAFFGCSNMQITATDTPHSGEVTNFSSAWRGCSSLASFPLIDTSGGTDFSFAWTSCTSLTSFPLIDTGSGTNFSNAWYNCPALTSFPALDTSNGTNFHEAWYNCSSLTSFPLINTSSGTDFSWAWYNCSGLTTFPLIDTSGGTSFERSWQNCSSLTSFPPLDTSSGTSFAIAWFGCSSLTSFPLIDTSSGTDFNNAWRGCSSLTSFPLIDTSSGVDFKSCWQNCTSLTSFPLIDTSNGTNFRSCWQNCAAITSFPAVSFASMTNGESCFSSVTLPTETWSNILVATEASNQNSGVDFNGGNSEYNVSGGTARAALISDHNWSITDGGAAESSSTTTLSTPPPP